jgi:hypothetical protein
VGLHVGFLLMNLDDFADGTKLTAHGILDLGGTAVLRDPNAPDGCAVFAAYDGLDVHGMLMVERFAVDTRVASMGPGVSGQQLVSAFERRLAARLATQPAMRPSTEPSTQPGR